MHSTTLTKPTTRSTDVKPEKSKSQIKRELSLDIVDGSPLDHIVAFQCKTKPDGEKGTVFGVCTVEDYCISETKPVAPSDKETLYPGRMATPGDYGSLKNDLRVIWSRKTNTSNTKLLMVRLID